MISNEYECYLISQMDELDRRQTRIDFRNAKKQLLFSKKLPNDIQHAVEEKFDKVEALYDEKNERSGSVFSQIKNSQTR